MKKCDAPMGKMSKHPGFEAMVHHGPKHPGDKAAMRKEMAAPMPQRGTPTGPMIPGLQGPPVQGGTPMGPDSDNDGQ